MVRVRTRRSDEKGVKNDVNCLDWVDEMGNEARYDIENGGDGERPAGGDANV
jgi:hypothetical protein